MTKKTLLVVFSLLLYLFGHLALFWKLEPIIGFFYVTSWWSYIILLDSIVSSRSGKPVVLNRTLPACIIISCGFWCFFELINLRLENWFYINVPYSTSLRYAGYLLAYGTVIPAIILTAAAVQPLFASLKAPSLAIPRYSSRAISLGIILFLSTIIFPKYLFALAWAFAIPLIDGINYRAGFRSFMAELERGDIRRFCAALLSGLICGILWETWNSLSPVKWIYTVPFFEQMKVFEMPLPGYIGFLVFGVETVAFADLLQGLRQKRTAFKYAVCGALVVSAISFVFIDRYTVFSQTTPISNLSFLTVNSKEMLIASGVRTNLSVDPGLLKPFEKEAIELVNLKGLGYENYMKLVRYGITGVRGLANLDETTLSHALGEKDLLRVRVYLAAAQIY